jgi:hypothetical protein
MGQLPRFRLRAYARIENALSNSNMQLSKIQHLLMRCVLPVQSSKTAAFNKTVSEQCTRSQ